MQTPEAAEKDAEEKQATEAKRMAELSQEVQKFQAELQKAQQELNKLNSQQRANQPLPGLEEVKAATLPENPTREQCEAYLTVLRDAVADRKSFSSSHLCVDKLRAIPGEHYDLLITEYCESTRLARYVRYAISDEQSEEHAKMIREQITSKLADYPNMITVVLAHGWCKDAEPAIKKMILKGELPASQYTAMQWMQAAVELQDPELYPRLHEITVESPQWQDYIGLLEILPDYDFAHTFNACFDKKEQGQPYYAFHTIHGHGQQRIGRFNEDVILLAAEAGNKQAFDLLIQAIPDTERRALRYSSSSSRNRLLAYKFMRFRGSNSEIQAWYKENKDKLVFDHLQKRFVVPEDF